MTEQRNDSDTEKNNPSQATPQPNQNKMHSDLKHQSQQTQQPEKKDTENKGQQVDPRVGKR